MVAWFKKKKEGEDIIPELPSLLEGGELLEEENLEEDMKEQGEESETEEIPEPVLQELEKESETQPESKEQEYEEEKIRDRPREHESSKRQVSDTQFIRIDKFETAYSSISNIKKKIEEMNIFLKDIRQLNAKEDAELSAWEREINDIKSKIENIDRSLFENLQ